MTKHKVIWCDVGWQPVMYGFCPSERAWNAEMARLKIKDAPYPTTAGACSTFTGKKSGKLCALVTINDHQRPPIQVVGLLVHETTHIWRHIKKDINEKKPSKEFEAYAMQAMTQELISAYEETRGKLFVTPKVIKSKR